MRDQKGDFCSARGCDIRGLVGRRFHKTNLTCVGCAVLKKEDLVLTSNVGIIVCVGERSVSRTRHAEIIGSVQRETLR